jgi:hypothetical protein
LIKITKRIDLKKKTFQLDTSFWLNVFPHNIYILYENDILFSINYQVNEIYSTYIKHNNIIRQKLHGTFLYGDTVVGNS